MTRDRKEKKAKDITEAAARVFACQGFAGTTIARIALEADVGKGTLYEYFDSKEELFFAVFDWFMEKTASQAVVQASALEGSASQRLMALVESVAGAGEEMMDQYSLAMEFWAASASSTMRDRFTRAFRDAYREFRGIVAALIREGVQGGEFRPDVDADSISAGLVGAIDGILLQAWFEEGFDPLATSRKFAARLLRGLAAKGDTGSP